MQSLRLAVRTLLKTPLVTTVACVSLALGLGANSAIFSLYDQMILRPLPVEAPERLVNFENPGPKPGSQSCSNAGDCDEVLSYPMFLDLEKAEAKFQGVAGHRDLGVNISYQGNTESEEGLLVTGGYFSTLGLKPVLGRLFGPEDNRTPGGHPLVVLAHDYWQNRFGGSLDAVGKTLLVNGQTLTVVGVAPEGFTGTTLGSRPKIFVPMVMREVMVPGWKGLDNRLSYWVYAFARLQSGVSLEEAEAAIAPTYRAIVQEVEAPLQKGMSEATMAKFKAKTLKLEPGARGQSSVRGESRSPLLMLLSVTAFVLAIACANVANLLLARSAERADEIAVRLSVGAGRGQLVRQLLTESCLLGVAAGVGGLLVGGWTLKLMSALLPPFARGSFTAEIDWRMMAFTALVAVATSLLFGLFPALHSTRPNLAFSLKGQANKTASGRAATVFRWVMVTFQITLAMVLLISAGLFVKSLANVSRVDLGLAAGKVLVFGVSPELNGYTPEQSRELFASIEREIAALPGVESVAASLITLLAGNNWGNGMSVEGFESGPDIDSHSNFNAVGPGFFSTLSIPLLAGREFETADRLGTSKVAIVNQAFAEKFGLGREAVGKRIGVGTGASTPLDLEIVGLVANAKYSEIKSKVPPQYFIPYRQDEGIGSINFYVKTRLAPEQVMAGVGEVMRRLDANLPIENLTTLTSQAQQNVFVDRMISTLSSAFAALATLLAAVGLYGVLAYSVALRTREIGLRMALGADGPSVRGLVLKQVGWMTIAGGVLGLLLALAVGRFARSMLYELEGHDPAVLGAAGVLLVLIALAAGLIPATRAARVEPMVALRQE